MEITRRSFAGRMMAGAGMLAVSSMTTACWFTGTVFTQIMSYVGVGLTAFQAVVDLLDPALAVAVNSIVAPIKAGFADLQLAVQAYNNAPAASKSTLLGKISTILSDLQSQIQNFWSNLNLPDGSLATLIQGLLGIILSTLAGFATQLPAPVAAPRALPAKAISVAPVKRNKKQFEKDFNGALVAAGKPAVKFS